jgi:hypothetical protein
MKEKIEIPSVVPVDKLYTRTFYQKDSLISNIRRALPREISSDIMETTVFPNLSKDQKDFLLNYYWLRSDQVSKYYFLRSIPVRLSKESASKFLKETQISEENKKLLLQLFQWNKELEQYVLIPSVSESDEIKLLQLFKKKSLHIRNTEKAILSEIFERFDEIPKKEIFFANLFTPTDHVFFSPPNLKHISGMQIIEAARQLGIACHHIFGKVPFEGVTFLLHYLNSEFFQYAKLNMPIKIRAILKNQRYNKKGEWNFTDFEMTVFQENTEIAKIKMSASILPLSVYKRLKQGQAEMYEIDPRFQLVEKFKNNISIRSGLEKFVCTIENISLKGFLIKSVGSPPESFQNKTLEFFMHFDIVGFIHGECKLLWSREDDQNDDIFFSGFEILSLSEIDLENLKESINRYGRLIEDREIT